MFIEKVKSQGKYACYLLRETYREEGKVKHRTIANLSQCGEETITAMKLALKHKEDLSHLTAINEAISLRQGLSVGAVWTIYQLARQLGLADALGHTREGKLALWQVIARVIAQGSRLSAVRLAGSHAACDILGLEKFDEEDLYRNLDWLAEKQATIEDRLFRRHNRSGQGGLYLYDVTSSYLEGECNELSAFGYNRDGKKGKRQIVIGLLCDQSGCPLSIEVFPGNTRDTATVRSQVQKLSRRFGGGPITFVGDRGMLKSQQVEELSEYGFNYITAITKPQIETLLGQGTIQMGLFDLPLAEVRTEAGIRYILRRNPQRAEQIRQVRADKLACLKEMVQRQNAYLAEHSRARVEIALRKLQEKCEQLKVSQWVRVEAGERSITLQIDTDALAEIALLDGCYVLKTDLDPAIADKETIHCRYKDLAQVEWAFRTSKTVHLELRPIHVRLASRTRGHCFVVMLAYQIAQELARRWQEINLTVPEGIDELETLCTIEVLVDGQPRCNKIPVPRDSVKVLLEAASVKLPEVLPCKGIKVATRKSLPQNRISH